MSEGYKAMMAQNEKDGTLGDYGDEDQDGADNASEALSGDQLDEMMEEQEEMDDNKGRLKIPDDVKGEIGDEYDQEAMEDDEPKDIFGEGSDGDKEDAENDVFAMAREH